jgi:hypothetical protein
MLYDGCFAMHQSRRWSHLSSEHSSDALVAEANSQDRNRRAEFLDKARANAGRLRSSGAGRQTDALGSERPDFIDGNLIVSLHHDIATQLTEILDEVVGERVVVIYD